MSMSRGWVLNKNRFLWIRTSPFENHSKGTTTYPGTETHKKPKCVDINECLDTVSACSVENECKNTFGSYYCECFPGYQYNEDTGSCDDLDECSPTGFICSGRADSTNFVCINTVGSYNCHCKPGLDTGGLGECLDWNECFSHGFKWTDRSQRLIKWRSKNPASVVPMNAMTIANAWILLVPLNVNVKMDL